MSTDLHGKTKRIVLSLAQVNDDHGNRKELRPPAQVRQLLQRARALNIPIHNEPQIAAVLASLSMSRNIPRSLYACASAVLATVYDAAEATKRANEAPNEDLKG